MLRRRRSFWLVLVGTTAFATVDPALFLVVAALALSGLALVWTVMLVRALLLEACVEDDGDEALQRTCPFRARRDDSRLSSSARPTS